MIEWLTQFEWSLLVPEMLGQAAGFLIAFAASWFLLFRKRVRALEKLRTGDSDDLLFQAHYLLPLSDGGVQLVFRSVAQARTVEDAYDNQMARDVLRKLADETTLRAPILPTSGRIGFEVLNDAAGLVCGALATSPMERQTWLFCMTCEDRTLVRKQCIRCFLIREADLIRFEDWNWCKTQVRLERPWHWFRIVALHRIALFHRDERIIFDGPPDPNAMPLVDDQRKHRRIVPLSLGIMPSETAIAEPWTVEWSKIDGIQRWVEAGEANPSGGEASAVSEK